MTAAASPPPRRRRLGRGLGAAGGGGGGGESGVDGEVAGGGNMRVVEIDMGVRHTPQIDF